MTPSLLHCTRSRPTNGLWLGLCLSLDAQTQTHTHPDKHTLIHAWVCISTNVYRRDCTRKKSSVFSYFHFLLRGVHANKKHTRALMDGEGGRNLMRGRKRQKCVDWDYPIHLSIPLHTWLPLQNMASAFHSTERWGTKRRWKNAISQLHK